ncbi:MAG: glycosyltransferase family 2 protein [Synechococcaceae cyanobacterium]|nr:glycosyltransferase family 2 protein [Synechococcaceae cyanobacterium]
MADSALPAAAPEPVRAAMSPATVTAVVPIRNRCPLTLRFLERISRQTHPALRVVVVDSQSSDGSVEAIRRAYPQVQVLAAGEDDFWAGATNIGVAHALASGSEWLLTINDDAVIAADHVERLLQLALRHGCRILGSQINHLEDPERIWSLGSFTVWGGEELLRLGHHGERSDALSPAEAASEVLPVDALAGNGVLIHHSVFRRIGLYNARWLPHYHADSELVMRAVAAGIPAWVTPRVVLLNDFSPSQKRLPLHSLRGLWWSLGHPKSHLYLPPLLYLLWRYCPTQRRPATLLALLRRFLRMRR